ncbi:hypothetical protein PHJA_002898000 [Phtheirospermum japonicum]|uniref:Uncharacterized protein n=1 Tax=Phtheirospermum japonicum TaxID=374723 RepID=A0A830DCU6_9LAMI|nr:hypothetical protein PHJA_002898000 [Phtheirospermum japonicum]
MPLPRLRRLSATPLPHRLLPTPSPEILKPRDPFSLLRRQFRRYIDLLHRRPPVPLHHWRRWRLCRLRGRAFAPQGTRH